MQTFWENVEDDSVVVLFIDVENESISLINSFISNYGITAPVLRSGGSFYSLFGNGFIPWNIVLDRDHILRYSASGYSSAMFNSWYNLIDDFNGPPPPPEAVSDLIIFEWEGTVWLVWSPPELDIEGEPIDYPLVGYEVHAAGDPFFEPSPTTLLDTVTDPSYEHVPDDEQMLYYRVVVIGSD